MFSAFLFRRSPPALHNAGYFGVPLPYEQILYGACFHKIYGGFTDYISSAEADTGRQIPAGIHHILIRALDNPALAGIPIAALSANTFEEDRRMSKESGMNEHLAKPVNMPQLLPYLLHANRAVHCSIHQKACVLKQLHLYLQIDFIVLDQKQFFLLESAKALWSIYMSRLSGSAIRR